MFRGFVAAVFAVALLAGPVLANQCPLLIKQLNDAVAKMKVGNAEERAEKRAGELLTAEAQKLHNSGNHAESVEMAEIAAKVLGVKLEMKKY